jgi:hypothetical protein
VESKGTSVFISHAAGEARFATDLARALHRRGIESKTDADVRRLGDEWGQKALKTALQSADWLLVIVSDRSITSPNLNFEVGAAIGQEIGVIPVLLSRAAGRKFRVTWLREALSDSVVAEKTNPSDVADKIARRIARGKPGQAPAKTPSPRRTVSDRKRIHVTRDKSGWQVRREGASRASARAATQAEAERLAKDIARRSGGAEVVRHGRDGRIRDSDTIPPARDHKPPRDNRH